MKYMIHAYPSRMWYVSEYLVPSLTAQGISINDITIWNDDKGRGCLWSCLDSFASLQDEPGGTWHLQDDVIICRQFAKLTKENDDGIVCGFFCKNFDLFSKPGIVPARDQWYSFPCIRIPNEMLRPFREWLDSKMDNPKYSQYVAENKHDDWFWKEYMKTLDMMALNLTPNLVDHIDYLVGGTLVNSARLVKVNRAAFFPDADLVDNLENELNSR